MSKATGSLKVASLLVAAGFSITACKKTTISNPVPSISYLQVVHTSPKTAQVTVNVDEKRYQQKISYLAPQKPYARFLAGKNLPVKLSVGNNIVAEGNFSFESDASYSLFIYDTLKANKLKFIVLKDVINSPGAAKANIRFLHLSPTTRPVDIDIFSGNDSMRLVRSGAYIGNNPDAAALSPFRVVAAGKYRVKVKTQADGRTVTLLDIPSLELGGQKTYTLFLKGISTGTADEATGLQLWMHK